MFGSNAPTNFEDIKSAVDGEMANALKGQATDPEIKNMSQNHKAAASPAQLQGAIEKDMHLLGQKLQTYQERYDQQAYDPNVPADTWSPVLPSAKAVFSKHSITSGPQTGNNMVRMRKPDGSLVDVPAQNVEAAKKRGGVVVP